MATAATTAAAASYLFIPTTKIHLNLNIRNVLPPSRNPCVSSLSKSISMPPHSSYQLHQPIFVVVCRKVSRVTALAQEAQQITEQDESAAYPQAEEQGPEEAETALLSPNLTKLYVGNLPQDCDNEKLTQIFNEFGPVESVEVIRNEGTGISRGFAYVSMVDYSNAVSAIEKLQGSDLGGRDMLVHFPSKLLFMGIGHKISVQNLAWSVNKERLISLFSQHGNVIGAKIIYDQKDGGRRVYGFVHLSTKSGMEAAIAALNGKEFHGRKLVVREFKATRQKSGVSEAVENISVKTATAEGENMSETSGTIAAKTPYKVYVGNLSRSLSTKALQELFSQYGNVVDARVIFDHKSRSGRVYGFISFSSQNEVNSAISALNGKEFYERTLVVQEAK